MFIQKSSCQKLPVWFGPNLLWAYDRWVALRFCSSSESAFLRVAVHVGSLFPNPTFSSKILLSVLTWRKGWNWYGEFYTTSTYYSVLSKCPGPEKWAWWVRPLIPHFHLFSMTFGLFHIRSSQNLVHSNCIDSISSVKCLIGEITDSPLWSYFFIMCRFYFGSLGVVANWCHSKGNQLSC